MPVTYLLEDNVLCYQIMQHIVKEEPTLRASIILNWTSKSPDFNQIVQMPCNVNDWIKTY